MIGQTISHYRIIEKLGQGGMGIVYKAEDTSLDRFVAIKFLPPHLAASEQDKARFRQEAKAAAAISHPNVCSIIEIAEHVTDDGSKQIYIVMEFVEGHTLREKKGSIQFRQAIDIGIQIAEGLAAAHEKGIVHRDIKPENIMIRKDGIPQIMDFGLAKLRQSDSKITRLTKEGSTIGTAGYMSPEQVQGLDTDHRSDIFSCGVVLYELLTGELPFKGVHETALLYEIVNMDPPPMSAVKPDIDPQLDAIILECLEKEPRERTQSIAQVALELKRYRRESTRQRVSRVSMARPVPRQQPPTDMAEVSMPKQGAKRSIGQYLWPAVSTVLGIAFVVTAFMVWRHRDETPELPVMRFSIDLPLTAPLVTGASTVAISPDGRHMVYLAQSGGIPKLFLRPLDQFEGHVIPGTDGASDPFFSPDGQWVAFFAAGTLKKVSVFGGSPTALCNIEGVFMRGGWWTADNSIWYGNINSGISRVPAGGGTAVDVTALDTTKGELSHRFPQLLPDGKTLLYTIKSSTMATFDDAIIATENIETHKRTVVVNGGSYGRYLPTGHVMYARGSSLYVVPFDANRMEVTGPQVPVIEGGMLSAASGNANFSFSDDGTLIYVPLGSINESDATLEWVDRQGKSTVLVDSIRAYGDGALSPEGDRVAITIRAANDAIWVYNITHGTLTRLSFGGGNCDFPIWTPDGKKIVFLAEKRRTICLFSKAWDGSGSTEQLGDAMGLDGASPPSISPDGKQIAFTKQGDIWVMPMEGDRKSTAFIHTPSFETWPVFSPDGRWLAYCSNETGRLEAYVVPFPGQGSKFQVSTSGGQAVWWSRDGKRLLYRSGPRIMEVDVHAGGSFDFSPARKAFDVPQTAVYVDLNADGSRALMFIHSSASTQAAHVNVVIGWFSDLKKFLSSGH